MPRTFALLDDGLVYNFNDNSGLGSLKVMNPLEAVGKLCSSFGRVVIKPVKGALGKNVFVVSIDSPDSFAVNNKSIDRMTFADILKTCKNFIIQEYIEQDLFSNGLYPDTTNTLRVLTMIDPGCKKPIIVAAVKRIGTRLSSPVDNFSKGGISVNIDIQSGVMGSAAQLSGNNLKWYDNHPDNGIMIKGSEIPDWELKKKIILDTARSFAFMKYIGWDIIESDKGLVFIEGNNHPDVHLLQVHQPLLKDNKVREFFKYHRVI